MSEAVPKMAPQRGVPMLEPEIVRQIRGLREKGWGVKRIGRELGIARNTVRRYVRGGSAAEVQTRPNRRKLSGETLREAEQLFDGAAEGNAVVVKRLLEERGITIAERTCQQYLQERRRLKRAAEIATVRFETAPGHQMQIDFGQKLLRIAGALVRVHLLVAVLSFSRRIFVKAFLRERQDDWREGIAAAFRHFGGVTRVVLGDNPKALVLDRDRTSGAVVFHPSYLQFCRDWDVEPRACAPYRARTKGKTESGVKYVKRNGLAGREFPSFAAMQEHLFVWMREADQRVHGTTHERPMDRFAREERAALRPLPARPLPTRERRLLRKVAHDALVDVDTVRYSVPCRLVRKRVEVLVAETEVRIFHAAELVALHRRSAEPFARVIIASHYDGLWRPRTSIQPVAAADPSPLEALGRSLADYAAIVEATS